MDTHVFPIPIPPPTSLSTRPLWVFPVYQVWALVSCIQPGLVICFTLDNIHVSMLFSWNTPPSPSPTESKSLFYNPFKFLIKYWLHSLCCTVYPCSLLILCIVVCILILYSYPALPSAPSLSSFATMNVFSKSVSLFLFCYTHSFF